VARQRTSTSSMLCYMLNRAESWSSSRHLTAKIRPVLHSGSSLGRECRANRGPKTLRAAWLVSGHDLMTQWSKLQELYFVGYAFLNYCPLRSTSPNPALRLRRSNRMKKR